jgi:group II intron reverse transcriptase/maturase
METLFELVCEPYNLRQAWQQLRAGKTTAERHKGAGVDGITLADWEVDADARLAALQAALWQETYHPAPLRWFHVPRREPGRTRRLGIPTVTDRVAQRAMQCVLEPIYETIFLSCSHGYRPKRSVYTAVAHILWHQAQGRTWVLDADIADYFNTVRHDRLLSQLARLQDKRVLALVASWLAVGATRPGLGLAQGAVISPLLANLYLHPFDVSLLRERWALVRYADDFVILCSDEHAAQAALVDAADALAARDLALNKDKTAIVPFGADFKFLGARFEAE